MNRGKYKYKQYSPKKFESGGTEKYIDSNGTERPNTFSRIYNKMLYSKVFWKLTSKQMCLYLIAKSQYYGSRKPKAEKEYKELDLFQGDEYFYLSWGAVKSIGMYTEKESKNFYSDMAVLINYGFIEKVASGKEQHRKTIYKFSDKWVEKE